MLLKMLLEKGFSFIIVGLVLLNLAAYSFSVLAQTLPTQTNSATINTEINEIKEPKVNETKES
ncbi:MAG: hypothetical protein HYW50_02590, partial [Candidatus Diapherotrites archaeon]|nr:hypothetical protein [Candidatus Diapherotrites archaeon]